MSGLQHVVLTRFSLQLRMAGHGFSGGFPTGWLSERCELLERYCLPSLAAQTCQEFTWMLLCDDELTDPEILDHLRGLQRRVPQLQVTPVGKQMSWRSALERQLDPNATTVITTRVDSDDALNTEAVAVLQEYGCFVAARQGPSLVVNFQRGWQLHAGTGVVTERWYPHSPFLSLIERPAGGRMRGVMYGQHTTVPNDHATHQDLSIVGWLQVIHGANVSNQVSDPDQVVHDPDLAAFGLEVPS